LQNNISIKKEESNSDQTQHISSFSEYQVSDIKKEEIPAPPPFSASKNDAGVSIIQ
jgi:hypothetical protein